MSDEHIKIKYEDSYPTNNNNNNEEASSSQSQQPSGADSMSELASLATLGSIECNVNANDKMAIYHHPLFPLLRLLFEKCESATKSIDNADSLAFEAEIKAYISELAKVKPFFTENKEIDTLVSFICLSNMFLVKHHFTAALLSPKVLDVSYLISKRRD